MLVKSYPVFVVKIHDGYALLSMSSDEETEGAQDAESAEDTVATAGVQDDQNDEAECAVFVFSTEEKAEKFIEDAEIKDAEVRFLRNERELAKVLAIQPQKVKWMAWDTAVENEELIVTTILISDMLTKHLKRARSPWDYPVFFLKKSSDGYAAVQADEKLLIAMFTTNQNAKEYRSRLARPSQYELMRVESPERLREILKSLSSDIFAVAIDPKVDETCAHHADVCMEIPRLIEKFLD
ncbi:MAG: hypothetical protein Q4D38_02520 [Planctomycetia bacterium]|nr:hypothetical protein [Planctomycetia bacterium]